MQRLEEWPSSTEFGLQACLLYVAPVFFMENRGFLFEQVYGRQAGRMLYLEKHRVAGLPC